MSDEGGQMELLSMMERRPRSDSTVFMSLEFGLDDALKLMGQNIDDAQELKLKTVCESLEEIATRLQDLKQLVQQVKEKRAISATGQSPES